MIAHRMRDRAFRQSMDDRLWDPNVRPLNELVDRRRNLEDVGMADPRSLPIADAAARAVEFVRLPEAQLNPAHAVVCLATAPNRTG